ncbi:hypothetical protein AAVH_06516 [Aphelenchoides avenae]|nr:hypothetical protein AAVH_06516 [Aphelenchus avenae]
MVRARQTPLEASIPVKNGSGVKKAETLTAADRIKRMQEAKRFYNDLSRKTVKPTRPTVPLDSLREEAASSKADSCRAGNTDPKMDASRQAQSTHSSAVGLKVDDNDAAQCGPSRQIWKEYDKGAPSGRMSLAPTGRLSIAPADRMSLAMGGSIVRRGPKIVKPIRPGVKPVVNRAPPLTSKAGEDSFVPATSVMSFRIHTPQRGRMSKITFGYDLSSVERPSTSMGSARQLLRTAQGQDENTDPVRRRIRFDDEPEIHRISEATTESSSNNATPEPPASSSSNSPALQPVVTVVKPLALVEAAVQTPDFLPVGLVAKELTSFTREEVQSLRSVMASPLKKLCAEVFQCKKPTEQSSSSRTEEVDSHPTNTDADGQDEATQELHSVPSSDTSQAGPSPRRSLRIAALKSPGLIFADQEVMLINENAKNQKKRQGGSRPRNPHLREEQPITNSPHFIPIKSPF